tara:strand:+ start:385 stop:2130 length:1746 start_codon:yes stop_codon:yes gene_type:complete
LIENNTSSRTPILEEKFKEMLLLNDIANENMAYCVIDDNLNIQSISKAFTDIFGYSTYTSKNHLCSNIITKEYRSKFYNGCEYVKNNGIQSWGTELILETIGGKEHHVKIIINPRFYEEKFSGFILIIHDITHQKLLNKLQVKMFSDKKLHENTLEFVSSTSAAFLDTISNKASAVVKIVVSFILLFIIYASFFEIDELSRGTGSFIPSAKVQYIKNYEGGIVSEILVREGDSVKKGQILVKLNPIAQRSILDENKIRLSELEAKLVRLKAESLGIEMKIIPCKDGCSEKHIYLEKKYYISNMQKLNKNLSKQKEQLKSKQSTLVDAENKFAILEINFKILLDEFKLKKSLEKKKIFTRFELGLLERALNVARSEIKSAKETIVQTKTQIQEILDGMDESILTFRNKASLHYNETSSDISRLKETKKNLQDIINRRVIRSPVKGVIKELFVNTLGSAVAPSAELLTIVPDNYELIGKVKIRPADIAKLYIGQVVKLKVTAFDYSIYGDLEGKITFISPDTITEKGKAKDFYIIHVKPKANYLNNNKEYKIKVGMTINADILVGKKSIMSFVLKPIIKSVQK